MGHADTSVRGRRLIRLADVRRLTGLSRTGIYARMAAGDFPAQVKLGGRAVARVESEVDAWVAARIERRGEENATEAAA